jgi:hypothetical protein
MNIIKKENIMSNSCEDNLQRLADSSENIEKILNQMMLSQSGHILSEGTISVTVQDKEKSINGILQNFKDTLFSQGDN